MLCCVICCVPTSLARFQINWLWKVRKKSEWWSRDRRKKDNKVVESELRFKITRDLGHVLSSSFVLLHTFSFDWYLLSQANRKIKYVPKKNQKLCSQKKTMNSDIRKSYVCVSSGCRERKKKKKNTVTYMIEHINTRTTWSMKPFPLKEIREKRQDEEKNKHNMIHSKWITTRNNTNEWYFRASFENSIFCFFLSSFTCCLLLLLDSKGMKYIWGQC